MIIRSLKQLRKLKKLNFIKGNIIPIEDKKSCNLMLRDSYDSFTYINPSPRLFHSVLPNIIEQSKEENIDLVRYLLKGKSNY